MENHLQLDDVLDPKAAAGLHTRLLSLRSEGVVLDASDVQRLGGQCLQVVLPARVAWRERGQSFSVSPPSDAFVHAFNLFGIQPGDLLAPMQQDQPA